MTKSALGTMQITLVYEGDPITEGVPLFKERFEQLSQGKDIKKFV